MKLSALLSIIFLVLSLGSAQQKWVKVIDITGTDMALSVKPTNDGGYVVTGWTNYYPNNAILIKLNASGDILWIKQYGANTHGFSVTQTSDGGYLIVGDYNFSGGSGDLYILKTNASGDTVWSRTVDAGYGECGLSGQQTSDGGYIAAGCKVDPATGNYHVYLVKTDASGNITWTRIIPLQDAGCYQQSMTVQQTTDGGYMVATHSWMGYNDLDYALVKTDANGGTQWIKYYGERGDGYYEDGRTGWQTSDGGYILFGSKGYGNRYVYVIKTNATGDTVWSRWTGVAGVGWASAHTVVSGRQTIDGGYIVLSTWYLLRLGPNGDSLWCHDLSPYLPIGGKRGYWVEQTPDKGYVCCGYSYYNQNYDIWVAKTDSLGNLGVAEQAPVSLRINSDYRCLPNPFHNYTTVRGYEQEFFTLYDGAGRCLGRYKGECIGKDLPTGVYFIRPSNNWAAVIRIVKVQ